MGNVDFISREPCPFQHDLIDTEGGSERSGDQALNGNFSVPNVHTGYLLWSRLIKIAMIEKRLCLNGFRKSAESAHIVVAIAFDMLDPQCVHHGEVLKQGNRADINKIFAADNRQGAIWVLLSVMFKQAGVGDAFKNSLAIFVTGSGVTEFSGTRARLQAGVGFINDEWWSVRP